MTKVFKSRPASPDEAKFCHTLKPWVKYIRNECEILVCIIDKANRLHNFTCALRGLGRFGYLKPNVGTECQVGICMEPEEPNVARTCQIYQNKCQFQYCDQFGNEIPKILIEGSADLILPHPTPFPFLKDEAFCNHKPPFFVVSILLQFLNIL